MPDPMSELNATVQYLRSPSAIRDRCGQVFELACADKLEHFRVDLDRLDVVAAYVLDVMQTQYPDGNVPFHSRWRHFEVGGIDRAARLHQEDAIEQARVMFDLVIPSVLLDAGAGTAWKFVEPDTNQVFGRSEGLAIASYHLFTAGKLSSDPAHRRTDAQALLNLSEETIATAFQVSQDNPIVGLSGRVKLLQRLGAAMLDRPQIFGSDNPRLGAMVDYLLPQAQANILPARLVFAAVLESLSDIWPSRIRLDGVNLGDVWPHSALPDTAPGSQLVPFHKLSQWLTYSLLEPLQSIGLQITHLDELTGLPEYRNGGLCLDLGLLKAKHPDVLDHVHTSGSEIIVEWRSLTVILLDRIADRIRQTLNQTETTLPLVKVLQGGTWTAGRQIAAKLRSNGAPSIAIESDGTVF
ncbi:URC4/urg3 family protein [Microcoleus sp. FACHB-1515]|uniref:URC4/urg3 family protein n=1 Tax=Cyanophyceae TaxID=3028117 RepID=UPI001682C812|nr:URC4/urg3 family protein [Microcoleus sp. FACHB-1515]MBD2091965.1 URC4/urg3 family protein [Microcoleus sp. FACHB-1515]